MLFGGSCVIGPNLHPVFANKKLEQDLNPKEAMPSRQLSMSNALFIIFYVTYAMQIMLTTQPDTFFNVLLNTKIRQSATVFMKRMVGVIFGMRVILRF